MYESNKTINTIILHHSDGTETAYNVGQTGNKVVIADNIKNISCLFCGRSKTITYSNSLLVSPLQVWTCKCGSVIFFTLEKTLSQQFGEFHISKNKIDVLEREKKIRVKKFDQSNDTNGIYQLQVFPLTDHEMQFVFTQNQVDALKHRLSGGKLSKSHINALHTARKLQKRIYAKWKILSILNI